MKRLKVSFPCMLIAFLAGLLIMGGVQRSFGAAARTQAAYIREKHVVSVMVEEDDSLWSIAAQYYTEECGSMKNYVAEIRKCNDMETDTIYAGYPLLIPVWTSEAESAQLAQQQSM